MESLETEIFREQGNDKTASLTEINSREEYVIDIIWWGNSYACSLHFPIKIMPLINWFSPNNNFIDQSDFEREIRSRRHVYEIDSRRNSRYSPIHNYHQRLVRTRRTNMDYRAIFYNQPSNIRNRGKIKRGDTSIALRKVFKNWRRGSSIKSEINSIICCIWLGEFEDGQAIIQLKCNKQHWFHAKCLEGWAKNNNTWPLWRTDYVEMAKEENNRMNKKNEPIDNIVNEQRV